MLEMEINLVRSSIRSIGRTIASGEIVISAQLVSIWTRRPAWLAPTFVAVVSAGVLLLCERHFQTENASSLPDGFRIHDISSNNSQQTLDVADMNSFGPKSLWYSHVYPPLLDATRYLLMLPETRAGLPPSGAAVDARLYWLFAALFGLVATVVYLWVRDLTRSGWWALSAAFLWSIAPASLITMTLLEPTPAAIPALAGLFYLLFRFLKTRRLGYATGFLAILLVASLVRNVVQVHVLVILVIAVAAFWFMSKKRTVWLQVLNCLIVALIFVWPVRAYLMYDTFDVSTHTGYHRAGALWIDPDTVPEPPYPQDIVDNALAFSSRFNTQETLKDNYRLSAAANDLMLHHPIEAVGRLWRSLGITSANALLPITSTTLNYMVAGVRWGPAYDFVFSGWRYILLILASATVIAWRRGPRGVLRLLRRYAWFAAFWVLMAIPVLFSNRHLPPGSPEPTHTEAARLKALIDIPVYVLIFYAIWLAFNALRSTLHRRQSVA